MGALEIERTPGVARVWLNRPDVHNAFNAEVITGLDEALESLGDDPEVRVIVLGGRGRRVGRAGGDVVEHGEAGPARALGKRFGKAGDGDGLQAIAPQQAGERCPVDVLGRVGEAREVHDGRFPIEEIRHAAEHCVHCVGQAHRVGVAHARGHDAQAGAPKFDGAGGYGGVLHAANDLSNPASLLAWGGGGNIPSELEIIFRYAGVQCCVGGAGASAKSASMASAS